MSACVQKIMEGGEEAKMESSPKLNLEEVVPHLDLPSNLGRNISLWDFKQRKNLVIFFHHGVGCSHCSKKLAELAKKYGEVNELDAEVLAISFDRLDKLKEYAEKAQIPFPLLSDGDGEATERFTYKNESETTPLPSIFITDRFGALRYQKIAEEAGDLPNVEEVLSWLLLIQCECPECSHL